MTESVALQALVGGIGDGMLYGLGAAGINVMYRPSHTFNFAQGDLIVLGGITGFILLEVFHSPAVAAIALVVLLGGLLAGLEERIAVRPILARGGGHAGTILTTLAVSLILSNFTGQLVGDIPPAVEPVGGLSLQPFRLGPVLLQPYMLAVTAWTVVVIAALVAAYRTKHGRAVRALAEDQESATLRGVPGKVVISVSWIIGGGLAMLTGLLAAPITFVSVSLGATLLIKSFEAVAIGGLGDARGALAGGLVVGIAESLAVITLGPVYRDIATFVVFLLVLLTRPAGLFGRAVVRMV